LAIEENTMHKMSSEFPQQSNLNLPKLEASKLAISEEKQPKQQMLIIGSDIGYSSGENNSVHEDGNGTTINTNSVGAQKKWDKGEGNEKANKIDIKQKHFGFEIGQFNNTSIASTRK
jgi:hypothetical protein